MLRALASSSARAASRTSLRSLELGFAASGARALSAQSPSRNPVVPTGGKSKTFALRGPAKYHLLADEGATTASATKEELLHYFTEMYTVRRMETMCDMEYKSRTIRGFCHLYDGQEAVGMGIQSGLSKADNVASSYRCHGLQYFRGDTVRSVIAELFGFQEGSSMGKGGSMHFYSKANRFWGGAGIVGAQIPLAGGVAFAEKYAAKAQPPYNVSIGMFGDGAANQGQIWETANMAKLWNLPLILLCENNQYGMGTSTGRSSCNNEYYKQGGVAIPGVQCDGMDVLAVRDAIRFCRAHASSGKGPIFLETKTYRYHGHSMSDPGITYRGREEVAAMRAGKDCIDQVKARLIEAKWATEEEMKALEKSIRDHVTAELEAARAGKQPEASLLYRDIHTEGPGAFVRHPDFEKSVSFA